MSATASQVPPSGQRRAELAYSRISVVACMRNRVRGRRAAERNHAPGHVTTLARTSDGAGAWCRCDCRTPWRRLVRDAGGGTRTPDTRMIGTSEVGIGSVEPDQARQCQVTEDHICRVRDQSRDQTGGDCCLSVGADSAVGALQGDMRMLPCGCWVARQANERLPISAVSSTGWATSSVWRVFWYPRLGSPSRCTSFAE